MKTSADALAAGNETLAEGMAEYKAEAIDKLTSLFDGDIANVTTRLKAITDAGKRAFEQTGERNFIQLI